MNQRERRRTRQGLGPSRPKDVRTDADSSIRTKRIRVVDGPLRDAVYDPSVSLTIGRGCDCDIQLIHDGVSRRHACITTDDDGHHVLVDLESTNGTFVDNQRIGRQVLEVGTIFEIVRNRLVYEDAPAVLTEDQAAPRQAGTPTHRTTVAYSVFEDETAAPPRGRWPRGSSPDVAAVKRKSTDVRKRHHYHGDVLADIAKYRSLRVRFLRGEPQSPDRVEEFRRLEQRMRPSEGDASSRPTKRAYRRFSCRIAARLRMFTGEELPVELTDLGVDGARVSVGTHSIMPETLLWLAIERDVDGHVHTLVFPGRAAWIRRRHIGVSFSGAPGWSQRGKQESFFQTRRDFGPSVASLQRDRLMGHEPRISEPTNDSGS